MGDTKKKKLKKAAIIAGVGTVAGLGAVAAAPLVIAAAGFGAGGVVAGSIAAGIQSWIGSVAAGSIFASLQSAGVLGLAAGTNLAVGAAVGTAASATAAGIVLRKNGDREYSKDHGKDRDKETNHISTEIQLLSTEIRTPNQIRQTRRTNWCKTRHNKQGHDREVQTDPTGKWEFGQDIYTAVGEESEDQYLLELEIDSERVGSGIPPKCRDIATQTPP